MVEADRIIIGWMEVAPLLCTPNCFFSVPLTEAESINGVLCLYHDDAARNTDSPSIC